MNEFKASNGYIVRPCENGGVEVGKPGYRDFTLPPATFALEEFFAAKSDADAGRWRYPEDKHLVVYRRVDGLVRVVDDRSGDFKDCARGSVLSGPYEDAARAYFRTQERAEDAVEVWKSIAGYEGYYEVSSLGQVRSVSRRLPDGRFWNGKPIRQCISTSSSDRLKVGLCKDGTRRTFKVHQIVAHAFLGPQPADRTLVLHNDGNHLNNAASNLRWGNYSDQVQDSIKHGTHRNQWSAS